MIMFYFPRIRPTDKYCKKPLRMLLKSHLHFLLYHIVKLLCTKEDQYQHWCLFILLESKVDKIFPCESVYPRLFNMVAIHHMLLFCIPQYNFLFFDFLNLPFLISIFFKYYALLSKYADIKFFIKSILLLKIKKNWNTKYHKKEYVPIRGK